jgi:SAM-dependent methyltransferase
VGLLQRLRNGNSIGSNSATKDEIIAGRQRVIDAHGPWTAHSIHLGHGIFTTDNCQGPHTRTAKLIRAIRQFVKPSGADLSGITVLDLGCLEGLLALECGLFGATATGVEIRDDSLAKATFARDMLRLENVRFVKGDALQLLELPLPEIKNGGFDVVLCCGLLYHFNAPDLLPFLENMRAITKRMMFLDTHFAFEATEWFEHKGKRYTGYSKREFRSDISDEDRARLLWASHRNDHSFFPTKTSLLNMLHDAGFETVVESFYPSSLNLTKDRANFLAFVERNPLMPVNRPGYHSWPDERISECDDRPRDTQWPDVGPVNNPATRRTVDIREISPPHLRDCFIDQSNAK